MKILVVNCGSSSIKYQLFDMSNESVLAKGLVERIGLPGSVLTHQPTGKDKVKINAEITNHSIGIELMLKALTDSQHGVIQSLDEISAIGHRGVHGGEKFADSTVITPEVIKTVEECVEMAPLHNPPNILGVNACTKLMPGKPQAIVFDTAFHQTMPKHAFMYALPYDAYKKHGIRRYGFHGTSHKYVAHRVAEIMGKDINSLKIVTCHLGNGASVAAVKHGKCIDTSMGFTPLEGLMMGTRCGDIDPAIIPFLMKKEHMTSEQVDEYMNKKSGVLGISGVSSDFRDVEQASHSGNDQAQLALDMFAYTVKKYIGSYIAAMNGADAVVFTAGLGENSASMREHICKDMDFLGLDIDTTANNVRGEEREISKPGSKVKIFTIPTNEELVIARDTQVLCSK
jgi:acetate kinase